MLIELLTGLHDTEHSRWISLLMKSVLNLARKWREEVLTIGEAAATSGYSVDHIRHQVAEGKIPNIGVKGSPRVRRGDLPLKSGPRGRTTGCDAAATARSILQSVGSETL